MWATLQYTLMVECEHLQEELRRKLPRHYLNTFYTKDKTQKEWDIATNRFYKKFSNTEKPWRKLSPEETTRAWENFRIYLYSALNTRPIPANIPQT